MTAKAQSARPAPPGDFFLDSDSLLRIFSLAGARTDAAPPPRPEVAAGESGSQQPAAAISRVDAPGKPDGDGALRVEADADSPAVIALGNGSMDGAGIRLGDLDTLSFDYYLGDGAGAAPTVRLLVDADGDLSTTGDRVQLVFEHHGADEVGAGDGVWRSADLTGGDWFGWQHRDGANLGGAGAVGLARWASAQGFTPDGGLKVSANSVVLDCFLVVTVGDKPTVVFLDNLQLGPVTYDFTI